MRDQYIFAEFIRDLNRRNVVILFALFLLLLLSICPIKAQDNVLLIYVDDLKPALNAYGDSLAITPHIDSLITKSTTFLNASCQMAICSPSRASMLTGRYIDDISIYNLSTPVRQQNPGIISIPQHFKNSGYATAGTGKIFHRGSVDATGDSLSWSHGFEEVPTAYFNSNTGSGFNGYHNPEVKEQYEAFQEYVTQNEITDAAEINRALKLFPLARPSDESIELPDDAYLDGARTKYAIDKMTDLAAGNSPFFMAVGYGKPHLPFVAPKQYWDLYDRDEIPINPFQDRDESIPGFAFNSFGELRKQYSDTNLGQKVSELRQKRLIHGYYACVSYIDEQIGQLLDHLQKLELDKNTIVVFVSDHGWHLGDHAQWAKHSVFEQAVRTPLTIYDPRTTHESPNISDSPVELVDLFPTLVDMTGIQGIEGLPGKSLKPILSDRSTAIRFAALSQYPRKMNGLPVMGYSLRSKRYRYTRWIQIDYINKQRCGELVGRELYDYQVDPNETRNLVEDKEYEEIVQDFEQIFQERHIAQSPNLSPIEIDLTVCSQYTFNGKELFESGTYTETFRSQAGCDSTVTLNLEIDPLLELNVDTTTCGPMFFYDKELFESGTYTETFISQAGCDSTVTLNLEIDPLFELNVDTTTCGPMFFYDKELFESGTYTETFISQAGCDSTVTLNLEIVDKPDSLSLEIRENTLYAPGIEGEYRWIDCSKNEIIGSGNQPSFMPPYSGEFSVELMIGNCSILSECVTLDLLLGAQKDGHHLRVYPNPAKDFFSVQLARKFGSVRIDLLDLSGKNISSMEYSHVEHVEMIPMPRNKGVYFVRVVLNEEVYSYRILRM